MKEIHRIVLDIVLKVPTSAKTEPVKRRRRTAKRNALSSKAEYQRTYMRKYRARKKKEAKQ